MRYHIFGCSVRNGNSRAIATVQCKIITSDLQKARQKLKDDMHKRFNTNPLNIDIRFLTRRDIKYDDAYNIQHVNILKEDSSNKIEIKVPDYGMQEKGKDKEKV